MTTARATIVLKDSPRNITGKINAGLAEILNTLLRRKQGVIIREIRELIPQAVLAQPEMQEITGTATPGSLPAQLGIIAGTGDAAAIAIANAVAQSIAIDVSKVTKKNLEGGIKLQFMDATFTDLLSLPEGYVPLEDGGELHWLDWLLTRGYTTIVTGYSYKFAIGGRSGGGFMRQPGSWRVPAQYAGTLEDNFITRALSSQLLEQRIYQVFKRHLK